MSFGFANIGHFFASAFHDIAVGARAVEKAAISLPKSEATVEGLTSLALPMFPQAVQLERLAYGVFGEVAASAHSVGDAAAANGLNVQLDAAIVAEIQALIAEFPQILAQGKAIFAKQPASPALPTASGVATSV